MKESVRGFYIMKTKDDHDRKLREKALTHIWGWASYLHEGNDKRELSDHFVGEVEDLGMSEEDAHRCQDWTEHEAEIIWRKLQRYKP